MRRAGAKNLSLAYGLLGLCFFIYEILTSVFSFLPLLYGFFFCYAFVLLKEQERTLLRLDFRWFFTLAFLLFADITHDFFLFSSWFAFFIFYYVLADWIRGNFKIARSIPIIFILSAYGLIFVGDWVLSYVNNQNVKIIHLSYALPICIEALLGYVFFKGRI
ncbi:hypothetical protein [Campylobacter sp.]|uniref:hypothetical protein n=1 Tax=Campylobacter sp. TaxID=205 RepID=UPI0026DC59D2|nr:hypothetical protein [Campylobacter sp.]MDO4674406.1 hypothetical protein [Campylobacter sp.]